MEEVLKVFANYGFPAVVAGYVLIRIEPAIKDLSRTVTALTVVVAKLGGVDMDEVKKVTGAEGC